MARGLLLNLVQLVCETQHWEDTRGKEHLWDTLLSLYVDLPILRHGLRHACLLSHTPFLYHGSKGAALLTMKDYQINVNVMVPTSSDGLIEFADDIIDYVQSTFVEHALLFTVPFYTYQLIPRRFIPSRQRIPEIYFAGGLLYCMGEYFPVESILTSIRDVAPFRHISSMDPDDGIHVMYWHRAPCGTLVLFRNAYLSVKEPVSIPPIMGVDDINRFVTSHPHIHQILRTVFSNSDDDACTVLTMTSIPLPVREKILRLRVLKSSISDRIILETSHLFSESTLLTKCMFSVYDLMETKKRMPKRGILTTLASLLRRTEHQRMWRYWCRTSEFVLGCIQDQCPNIIRQACELFPALLEALSVYLYRHIDDWTNDDVAKGRILASRFSVKWFSTQNPLSGACPNDEMYVVCTKLQELDTSSAVAMELMDSGEDDESKHQHAKVRSSKKKKKRRNTKHAEFAVADTCMTAARPNCRTHQPLVERMRLAYPNFDIEMIGSGLFSAESDIDVIICMDTNVAMKDAYSHVIEMTGWKPCYDEVSGDHVAVLAGEFEGISVDAQVLRRSGESAAEKCSRTALSFSGKLSASLHVDNRRFMCEWHGWFDAAGLKGHRWCRVSGIGVTCTGLILRAQTESMEGIIGCMREALSQDSPLMNADDLSYVGNSRTSTRPTCALQITLDGKNCTNRMTSATTRHMLDTLAFAIPLSLENRLARVNYDRWRKATMVHCALMRPRNTAVVYRTLHSILASLDGHPLIDSMHVDDDPNGRVLVRVVLMADADADRYGIRPTDCISVERERVLIHRNGRSMPLLMSPRSTEVHASAASRVNDMLRVDGMPRDRSFPNAAGLSVDVASRFSAYDWEDAS